MITANATVSFDEDILTSVEIYDSSDYTGSLVSYVTAVRIMFGTVNSVNDQTSTSSLEAWREYTADQSVTINGVTYASGDIIYLAADADLGTDTATETGFYGQRQTWIPSNGGYVSVTPTQSGSKGGELVFNDSVFTCNYELYTTSYSAGTITVSTETQYIVKGTAGQYISIGGEKYYVGEVFVKDTNFTFSGTPTIAKLEDSATIYFATTAQAFQTLQDFITALANNQYTPAGIEANMLKVIANYSVVDMAAAQSYSFDLQYMQNLLDEIQNFQTWLSGQSV